eukprot:14698120-Alexandrium_andersonii.AAC.1
MPGGMACRQPRRSRSGDRFSRRRTGLSSARNAPGKRRPRSAAGRPLSEQARAPMRGCGASARHSLRLGIGMPGRRPMAVPRPSTSFED